MTCCSFRFSDKWLINSPCQLLLDSYSNGRKQPLQRDDDLYSYQLNGSALSGRNNSKVWSVSEQKKLIYISLIAYLNIYVSIRELHVRKWLYLISNKIHLNRPFNHVLAQHSKDLIRQIKCYVISSKCGILSINE